MDEDQWQRHPSDSVYLKIEVRKATLGQHC